MQLRTTTDSLTPQLRPLLPEREKSRFRLACSCSLLHGDGVAPATAAELLGHEVGTHLQYYVKPIEGAKSAAVARLGGLPAAGAEG